jgi:hypothetical protein
MGPTPEGLKRELQIVVAQKPQIFTRNLEQFKNIDPTYVRGVFEGLLQSLNTNDEFDWASTLDFAKWVVMQPREIEGRVVKDSFDQDQDWGYTRSVIARLISAGLKQSSYRIPFQFRNDCFSILSILSSDPDPSREQELKYSDSYSNSMLSINSTRGEALHALFDCIPWVADNLLDQNALGSDKRLKLEDLPEIENVLKERLDLNNDMTAMTRYVIGKNLGRLLYLSDEWFKSHFTQIFSHRSELTYLSDAAFEGCLEIPLSQTLFDLLHGEFESRIERLSQGYGNSKSRNKYNNYFVFQIIKCFLQGWLSEDLLDRFYVNASLEARQNSIWHIGRMIGVSGTNDDHISRMMLLWEKRLAFVDKSNSENVKELFPFVFWLTSDRLDVDWAFKQIFALLNISDNAIGNVYELLIYLRSKIEHNTYDTLRCLERVLLYDGNLVEVDFHSDGIYSMLKHGCESEDTEIINLSKDIVNKLGSKGFQQFRDLS